MKRKKSALRSKLHPTSDRPRSTRRKDMISVDVVNRQRALRIAASKLKSVARLVLRAEGVRSAHIELALVDDATISAVHQRFFKLDTPTDVLTFPLHEPRERLAGQILLSVETATRVGPVHGLTAEEEVLLYAIHGILHLCGYDDRSARDARRMRRRQELLLRKALDSF